MTDELHQAAHTMARQMTGEMLVQLREDDGARLEPTTVLVYPPPGPNPFGALMIPCSHFRDDEEMRLGVRAVAERMKARASVSVAASYVAVGRSPSDTASKVQAYKLGVEPGDLGMVPAVAALVETSDGRWALYLARIGEDGAVTYEVFDDDEPGLTLLSGFMSDMCGWR